jgi:hypothetical protein
MATKLSSKLTKMVTTTNTKISKLTSYGERGITVNFPGNILEWSNSLKGWKIGSRVKPGKYQLDANEIIIEANESDIETIKNHLDILPLYKKSYEGRGGK